MKQELIKSVDEFNIPNSFFKYKYLAFVAKTTSQKYDFILYTMRKQPNFDTLIKNKLWHICAFDNSIEDFINFGNLLNFTEGLKNVYFYQDNVLLTIFNSYRVSNIISCVKNAQKLNNYCTYCHKKEIKLKDDFNNPLNGRHGLSVTISLDIEKKEEKKFREILAVKQTFPCHQINNNFNPYEESKENLKEVYLSNSLKQDAEIVNFCPLFNHNEYTCEFINEVRYK